MATDTRRRPRGGPTTRARQDRQPTVIDPDPGGFERGRQAGAVEVRSAQAQWQQEREAAYRAEAQADSAARWWDGVMAAVVVGSVRGLPQQIPAEFLEGRLEDPRWVREATALAVRWGVLVQDVGRALADLRETREVRGGG